MITGTVEMIENEIEGISGGMRWPDFRTQQYLRFMMAWSQDAGMTMADFLLTELGKQPEYRSFILRNWNLV